MARCRDHVADVVDETTPGSLGRYEQYQPASAILIPGRGAVVGLGVTQAAQDPTT